MAQHIWFNEQYCYFQELDENGLIISSHHLPVPPTVYHGYKVTTIQNTSGYSGETPTIKISSWEDGWDEAYQTWKTGKPPTDSKEWKKGVCALTTAIAVDTYWYFVYVGDRICSGLFSSYELVKKDQLFRKKLYPKVEFKLGKVLKSKFSETLKARGIKFGGEEYPTQRKAYLDKIKKDHPETFEDLQKKYEAKLNTLKNAPGGSAWLSSDERGHKCHKPDPPSSRQIAAEIAAKELAEKNKNRPSRTAWEVICDWCNDTFVLQPDPPQQRDLLKPPSVSQDPPGSDVVLWISLAFLFGILILVVALSAA